MLQEPDVARHQSRRRKPNYLPKGKVPRHYGQDRSKWLVVDVAAACRGFDYFVGKKALGILGKIVACPSAFDGFVYTSSKRLAHFGGHEPAESLFLSVENVCSPDHHSRAFGEWKLSMLGKRRGCTLKFFLNLCVRQWLKCLEELPSCRVDACDRHCYSPRSRLHHRGAR